MKKTNFNINDGKSKSFVGFEKGTIGGVCAPSLGEERDERVNVEAGKRRLDERGLDERGLDESLRERRLRRMRGASWLLLWERLLLLVE